jgi:C-terminal processing protease CtpA/Prc
MPQQNFGQQGGYQQSYGAQGGYPPNQAGGFGTYPQSGSANAYSQNPYGNQGYANPSSAVYPGGMPQQSNPYQGQQRPVYQQQQYPQMGMQGNPQQMGMQNSQYGSPMQSQPQFSQQQPVSSQDLATTYGLKVKAGNEGCQVVGLRSGSRAEQSGLQIGDVIRTADGNEVMQPSQLNQVLQQLNSMQRFPMLIFRNGNIQPIQF